MTPKAFRSRYGSKIARDADALVQRALQQQIDTASGLVWLYFQNALRQCPKQTGLLTKLRDEILPLIEDPSRLPGAPDATGDARGRRRA